ncbi:hypothetical protein GGR76_004322, partial [Xanthomonas translucens]|nr:hypothetical protein [Xanthomonas campestris]
MQNVASFRRVAYGSSDFSPFLAFLWEFP